MKPNKKTPAAIALLRSWRAPIAFAFLAGEIALYLLRALLRLPALPFLLVAEWYYRTHRARQEYWADVLYELELKKEREENGDELEDWL